jgi:hypothetical protein
MIYNRSIGDLIIFWIYLSGSTLEPRERYNGREISLVVVADTMKPGMTQSL